jgi:hypothetical protein
MNLGIVMEIAEFAYIAEKVYAISRFWGIIRLLQVILDHFSKMNFRHIPLSHYPEFPGLTTKNTLRLLYRAGIFWIVSKGDIPY